jgi:hypothetical protein
MAKKKNLKLDIDSWLNGSTPSKGLLFDDPIDPYKNCMWPNLPKPEELPRNFKKRVQLLRNIQRKLQGRVKSRTGYDCSWEFNFVLKQFEQQAAADLRADLPLGWTEDRGDRRRARTRPQCTLHRGGPCATCANPEWFRFKVDGSFDYHTLNIKQKSSLDLLRLANHTRIACHKNTAVESGVLLGIRLSSLAVQGDFKTNLLPEIQSSLSRKAALKTNSSKAVKARLAKREKRAQFCLDLAREKLAKDPSISVKKAAKHISYLIRLNKWYSDDPPSQRAIEEYIKVLFPHRLKSNPLTLS